MTASSAGRRVRIGNRLLMLSVLVVMLLAAGGYVYLGSRSAPRQHLIVSTTTSLYETGLLDVLKVEFERRYPSINVSFISQGTVLAMQTAMRGDADMILVHDPERELKFLRDGYGVNRKVIAYNFFVVVGPKEDPAKVKGLSPIDALKKIKESGEGKVSLWVSRGDDSGTHAREKGMWKTAGFDVAELRRASWYLEAGSTMTATLKMAEEKEAYTLADLGTYLVNYSNRNIRLEVIVEAGKDTLNVYSAIANNPRRTGLSKSNFDASMKLIRFLTSDEGQAIFEQFGKDRFGRQLFNPYIRLLMSGSNPELLRWVQELAYFDGTECPSEYRYESEGLY